MYSDLQEDTLCLWWVELSKFIYVLLCQRICYFVLFERTKKCCNCLLSYLQLVFFACLLSDTVTFSWVLYYRSTGSVDHGWMLLCLALPVRSPTREAWSSVKKSVLVCFNLSLQPRSIDVWHRLIVPFFFIFLRYTNTSYLLTYWCLLMQLIQSIYNSVSYISIGAIFAAGVHS